MFLAITINQWIGIFVAILALIPAVILLNYYSKTHFIDYFLFGLFFLCGAVVLIADPLDGLTNILIFYQIHHISIDTGYLLLFLHAIRMRWRRTPRTLLVIGIGWYILLFIMTSSWQLMIQPAYAQVVFWYLPHTFSSYFPYGAGLKINGIIIYSTAFRYWGELYRLYAIGVLLYAYITVKPILYSEKIFLARKLWIGVWFCMLLHAISLFPWFDFTQVVDIFLFIAGLIFAFISIRIPEAILISESQLLRVKKLYDKIEAHNIDASNGVKYEIDFLGNPHFYESIRKYIENISSIDIVSDNTSHSKDDSK